MQLTVQTH